MSNQSLPTHLQPFNCLTIQSTREFSAVWDNLSFENQLSLMKYVIKNKLPIDNAIGDIASYIFRETFFKNQLKHHNEYIRYLSVREIIGTGHDRSWYNTVTKIFQNLSGYEIKIKEKSPKSINSKAKQSDLSHLSTYLIEDKETLDLLNLVSTDSSSLVRFSLFEGIEVVDFESRMGILEKEYVDLYWSLPKEGKLALVKTREIENCLLEIVKKCVDEKNPNDYYDEIDQVLAEYVAQETFKRDLEVWRRDEPYFKAKNKRDALFCILEKLPDGFFRSYGEVFCREVQIHPDESNDEDDSFCDRFKNLPLDAQAKLLKRKDIKLQKYRKKIIFNKKNDLEDDVGCYVLRYAALSRVNFAPKELGQYLTFLEDWRESLEWDKQDIVTEGEEYIMSLDHFPLWIYAAIGSNNPSYENTLEEHIKKAKKLKREGRMYQYKWLLFYFFARDTSQRSESFANDFLTGSLGWIKEYVVSGKTFETLDNFVTQVLHSNEFSTFFSKNFHQYDFDAIFDLSDMSISDLYLEVFKDFKNFDEKAESLDLQVFSLRKWLSEKFEKNSKYQVIAIVLLLLIVLLK